MGQHCWWWLTWCWPRSAVQYGRIICHVLSFRNRMHPAMLALCAPPLQASKDPAPTLLQLVVSHARSQRQQLQLTAQLLPLCSSMPQWLAGAVNLSVTANTISRATEVTAWLSKYACMINTLDVEAVVDCCTKDAHTATTALATGITAALAANKVSCDHRRSRVSGACPSYATARRDQQSVTIYCT